MNGNKAPKGFQYFCRGCGGTLPLGWHGQFHPECLKVDKRRRTQEKRRLERQRFQAWLEHQRCPECGARMSAQHGSAILPRGLADTTPRVPDLE
jgi:hypothetical protein